jgi:hypothetical protein
MYLAYDAKWHQAFEKFDEGWFSFTTELSCMFDYEDEIDFENAWEKWFRHITVGQLVGWTVYTN